MKDSGHGVALKSVDMAAFKPLEFQYDKVHTCGGLLKSPMPMVTGRAKNIVIFIKFTTHEPWLLYAAIGSTREGR